MSLTAKGAFGSTLFCLGAQHASPVPDHSRSEHPRVLSLASWIDQAVAPCCRSEPGGVGTGAHQRAARQCEMGGCPNSRGRGEEEGRGGRGTGAPLSLLWGCGGRGPSSGSLAP